MCTKPQRMLDLQKTCSFSSLTSALRNSEKLLHETLHIVLWKEQREQVIKESHCSSSVSPVKRKNVKIRTCCDHSLLTPFLTSEVSA